jgi:hypothetical protein
MVIIELKHYFTGGTMTELYSGPYPAGEVMTFYTIAEARQELFSKGYSQLSLSNYDAVGIGDKANVYYYIDSVFKPRTFDLSLGILKETVAIIRNLKIGGR